MSIKQKNPPYKAGNLPLIVENGDVARTVKQRKLMQLKKADLFSLFGHQINKLNASHGFILYLCLNENQAFLSRLRKASLPAPV